jgi:hypothetical protein
MNGITDYLRDFDDGKIVETVEMGGISPGYEIVIQELFIQALRLFEHKKVPEDEATFVWVGRQVRDQAVDLLKYRHGFSGAQVGAATNLSAIFWKQTPTGALTKMRKQDPGRIIKIKKGKTPSDLLEIIEP